MDLKNLFPKKPKAKVTQAGNPGLELTPVTLKPKKENPLVVSLKEGFKNINVVAAEGNYKVFAKPVLFGVIVCFALYYYNGGNAAIINQKNALISSLRTQKEKMVSYEQNKEKILEVEGFFPDIAGKNEWLITEIIDVFDRNNMRQTFTGPQQEEAGDILTAAAMGVSLKGSYYNIGKLVSDIENRKNLMKVQELNLIKDDKDLGLNNVTMKIGTIFPKERIAAKKGEGK
ncbi:hypothetical protein Emin_0576 [Elusimicrobium minutum Pei191]|uniref:Uncharacterized protein n=1 Tax=Elusimicrobium minutum (strain Pei191) TaxID=445932 RepID=B2KC04_ELUMP|nr:type 4a pilus biogenesis protein PilO [Elusimicrobium minutum]ACC98131.1 hypothetical protein Emin_0576 [Elusimicrobium minutum Pei191]